MILELARIGGTEVLAGAQTGKAALNELLSATSKEPGESQVLFLDFNGIEVATASFLRECVIVFRDIIRTRRSRFYPVVSNASILVREELDGLLRARGDAMMSCDRSAGGSVSAISLLGELDPKQKLTFELVGQLGETDASSLMRDYGESEGVKHATAWNNRLTSLASLGLIIEQSQGRSKRYRPLFEGVETDGS